MIKRALISVSDKTGLKSFVKHLLQINPSIELLATHGTGEVLKFANLPYMSLEQYTGYPECFRGRVKTLHPKVAGGILMQEGLDDEEAKKHGIQKIDLIVCNLYDFETEQNLEAMDIGGSTLIRAGCKNYNTVVTLVDPNDYEPFIAELESGQISLDYRKRLAIKAIQLSAHYEACIAKSLSQTLLQQDLAQENKLRYGENPDQRAWLYTLKNMHGIASAKQLLGKKLSYNNFEDASSAYQAAQALCQFGKKGAVVIKHSSLLGYACSDSLQEAFSLAWEADAKSAFGSVIALTCCVTADLIDVIVNKFIEVLIAPEFTQPFLDWAKKKKPFLRLLQCPMSPKQNLHYKSIHGGVLVQTPKSPCTLEKMNAIFSSHSSVGAVTDKKPHQEQRDLFVFAINAVQFVKSNAVVIVKELESGAFQLIGVGGGQPSRIDSIKLCIAKAVSYLLQKKASRQLESCVLASDGFFPFDDSVLELAKAGIRYCIQPGGSIRDKDVIHCANACKVCMVFTGERYFLH